MKKTYLQKGFTLIELLVVIAIIGILSSVVLASLNTARAKGADTNIKSNLANIRAQAEIQYDSLGCYSNSAACTAGSSPAAVAVATCPTSGTHIFGQTNIQGQIADAKKASGGLSTCIATVGGASWAVAVQLKRDLTKAWCVDSTGASKQISSASAYIQGDLDADVSGAVCGS